nr:ArsR family transcriptional regulator [Angustibacter aerolatus]
MVDIETTAAPLTGAGEREQRTRDRVARTVLEHGPLSAADVACRLGVTPAAVRRHLDALEGSGQVQAREPRRGGTRGRGRPARVYVITDAGHATMTTAYDDLAASAMAFLAEQARAGRRRAVRRAPGRRASSSGTRPSSTRPGRTSRPARRRSPTRSPATGTPRPAARSARRPPPQGRSRCLCQGHCPVQHVAERFPQPVRRRDRGVLAAARRARAAPGHAGRRRARLHHARPTEPADPARAAH